MPGSAAPRVYVFGNGGSAYNSSHHVTDYVKTASVAGKPRLQGRQPHRQRRAHHRRRQRPVVRRDLQLPAGASYAQARDVAVGISCSGNSPNLLRACRWAKDNGLTVVALTGFAGGKVKDLANIHINVPSENYGVIEDLHMSVGHVAAQLLQNRILSESSKA